MDKQKSSSKSKNTILKFLPRATSSVSFQNPPIYSPSKENVPHIGIGFTGPMITGDHTCRKINNHRDDTSGYEPTSPRVSCMGQVKCKYSRAGNRPPTGNKPLAGKNLRLTSDTPEKIQTAVENDQEASDTEIKSKKNLGFKKLFSGVGGGTKSDAGKKKLNIPLYLDKAPSLSTMKRFSSGRDKLSEMDSGDRRYDSDYDEDVIVPCSAPVMIRNPLGFDDQFVRVAAGNLEPRKEINLWKRRTMPQPKPLLLHNI